MSRNIIISTVILMLISCNNDHQFSSSQKEKISLEVKETLLQYYGEVKRTGLLAEFNYLDSSEDFFWVPPSYDRWLGFDTVAAIIKRNAAAFDSIINSIDTIHVTPLSPNLASYTARISSRITDKAGHASAFQLIETAVMIRRKGGWKLLQGQTTIITR